MHTITSRATSMIVAMTESRVIGHHNQLLWHLPADLKHFKSLTTNNIVLMGRKTYLSIGRPLPNRTNIILTHDTTFQAPGCEVFYSLQEALNFANPLAEQEIFIIGGSEIYQQCLPITQRIYLTLVHHHFIGETVFPMLNHQEWQETERVDHPANEANPYPYSFLILERVGT